MNIQTLDIFEENDVSAFEFVEDLESYKSHEGKLLNIYSEYKGAILRVNEGICAGQDIVFLGVGTSYNNLTQVWQHKLNSKPNKPTYWDIDRFNEVMSLPSKPSPKTDTKALTKEFIEDVHSLACEKGWWKESTDEEHELAQITRALLMIHGEVSEATECFRDPEPKMSEKIPEYPQSAEELADVVIRCLDLGEFLGEDLLGAIKSKHEYNKGREYRHGGKLL
jgi:NTP pyrophosphatase (non-canonical NTP hydrolase)